MKTPTAIAVVWIWLLALACLEDAARAADFVRTDSPTAGIQETIDALTKLQFWTFKPEQRKPENQIRRNL